MLVFQETYHRPHSGCQTVVVRNYTWLGLTRLDNSESSGDRFQALGDPAKLGKETSERTWDTGLVSAVGTLTLKSDLNPNDRIKENNKVIINFLWVNVPTERQSLRRKRQTPCKAHSLEDYVLGNDRSQGQYTGVWSETVKHEELESAYQYWFYQSFSNEESVPSSENYPHIYRGLMNRRVDLAKILAEGSSQDPGFDGQVVWSVLTDFERWWADEPSRKT